MLVHIKTEQITTHKKTSSFFFFFLNSPKTSFIWFLYLKKYIKKSIHQANFMAHKED